MKREDLNFEPFYYVEPPIGINDEVGAAAEYLFKYFEEKKEVELFLKECSLDDFIWVIINLFKHKYARGSLLGAIISETIQEERRPDGVLYFDKFYFREDLDNPKYKFNQEDHFEYLEFDIVNPFPQINAAVEEALSGKQYTKEGDRYILTSDSGIEYIEATPNHFKLKANMSKSKRFH